MNGNNEPCKHIGMCDYTKGFYDLRKKPASALTREEVLRKGQMDDLFYKRCTTPDKAACKINGGRA